MSDQTETQGASGAAGGGSGLWVNPQDSTVLILANDALLFASPSADKLKGALEAMARQPERAMEMLGRVKGVPLDKVTKVSSNLKRMDVKFEWGPRADDARSYTAATAEQRDEVLAAMQRVLGPTWRRQDKQFSPMRAAVSPLISAIVFGVLTAVFYMAVSDAQSGEDAEIHGRRALLKRVVAWGVETLGPTGVLVVGGLIVAMILVWLVVRVKNPPLMAVIKKG